MTKGRSLFCYILILSVFSLIFPYSTHAADNGDVGYSVQALLPANQLDTNQTYFDLRVDPEQEQELEVEIYNNEPEDITVRTAIHNASTNSNGLIVYEEQEETDPSLKVPLTDILTLEDDEVVVPAGETKKVTAELEMPEKEFDGTILGGFYFEKVTDDDEEATEGVNLKNKYAYVIGVQLTENDQDVAPALHLQSIEPELVNYRTAVTANVQNSEPVLAKDLTINAKVYEKDEDEPVKERKEKDIKMAPNSNMNFIIDWENKALEPGDYVLEMKAEDDEDKWEWEESFEIEKDDAKSVNEEAVELDEEHSNMWFIIGIILLIVIIGSLLVYIRKLKRTEPDQPISRDKAE